MTCKQHYEQNL